VKLTIVVPTRNRPDLAVTAVDHLLAGHHVDRTVVVSDNSSSDEARAQLRERCEARADDRLVYVRPPVELDMASHWDWALGHALDRTEPTHLSIHYDRKAMKPGGLDHLAEACRAHPDSLVTYPVDFTFPAATDFGIVRYPGTGRAYEIATRQVVSGTAAGQLDELGQAWPLLSNCIVPRAVIEDVRAAYGTICASVTPDASFAYRFCARHDRFVHLDRPVAVMYAFALSNGQAYFRQDSSGPFGDFLALWGERPWLDAAPIPGVSLGLNVIFHEYNLVRRATGGDGLPPLDMTAYVRALARGLPHLTPDRRQAMQSLLVSHGWQPDPEPARAVRRVRPLWLRRWWRRPEPAPPPEPELRFPSDVAALEHLLHDDRPMAQANPLLDPLEPLDLPAPGQVT
jgi:hypothetical protein